MNSLSLACMFVLCAVISLTHANGCIDTWGCDIICEDRGNLEIDCGPGKYIEIIRGNYGRTEPDSVICEYLGPLAAQNDDTSCDDESLGGASLNTFGNLQAACDGNQMCSVPATNANFGDPCFLTYKYIEATWRCRCIP